jgi:hypothetical protein
MDKGKRQRAKQLTQSFHVHSLIEDKLASYMSFHVHSLIEDKLASYIAIAYRYQSFIHKK